MNIRIPAVLAAMILVASPLWANWGATFDQCVKQYGKPVKKLLDEATGNVSAAVFTQDSLMITVAFRGGKAHSLDYRCKSGESLTIAQILEILLAHETADGRFYPLSAYEEPVKPLPVKDHVKRLQATVRYHSWLRSDNKLIATFVLDKGALRISPAPEIKISKEKK